MKYQQWNIAQRSQEAYKAMERQGVPTLVAATLCARGMTDLAEAKGLLSSGEDQLQDPFLMKDMDLATARIGRALRNGEKIAVYGDYDVDGITSTCLLTHYLRAQGGDVCYYIPNRLSEGYGVNREAVEELARQGVRLIDYRGLRHHRRGGGGLRQRPGHRCDYHRPSRVQGGDSRRRGGGGPPPDGLPLSLQGSGRGGGGPEAGDGPGGPEQRDRACLPGVRRPGRRGHRGRRDAA